MLSLDAALGKCARRLTLIKKIERKREREKKKEEGDWWFNGDVASCSRLDFKLLV